MSCKEEEEGRGREVESSGGVVHNSVPCVWYRVPNSVNDHTNTKCVLAATGCVCHSRAVQGRLSPACSAHCMAVELFLPLHHRGHEVTAVVLDRGGQADSEEVTGRVKAG